MDKTLWQHQKRRYMKTPSLSSLWWCNACQVSCPDSFLNASLQTTRVLLSRIAAVIPCSLLENAKTDISRRMGRYNNIYALYLEVSNSPWFVICQVICRLSQGIFTRATAIHVSTGPRRCQHCAWHSASPCGDAKRKLEELLPILNESILPPLWPMDAGGKMWGLVGGLTTFRPIWP